MTYHLDDTIAAIATSAGGAARGLVRVSGRDAVHVADTCFSADSGQTVAEIRHAVALPGKISLRMADRELQSVPTDLFVWPTSRSYTREPVVEFHGFGSAPLLEGVLGATCRAGARLAEPGEFTLRAFLAGRLDLTQAEAVLGVIDARGGVELDAALAQLAGGLGGPLQMVRGDLLQLLAELEAGLDFVDEDIEFISREEISRRLSDASSLLDRVERQMASRVTTERAPRITLVGEPNAGKSSLFNALVARHHPASRASASAIVSSTRGTTRDYLTEEIDLGGVRCELVDTAGIDREDDAEFSDDQAPDIDTQAQSHAKFQSKQAVIRVWCIDASRGGEVIGNPLSIMPGDVMVATKVDLRSVAPADMKQAFGDAVVATSAVTGEGLDRLSDLLNDRVSSVCEATGQVVGATADRCRESILLAKIAVARAAELAISGHGEELIAAEVRGVLGELGKVVGAVYTDDVLDRIFKTFCIGK